MFKKILGVGVLVVVLTGQGCASTAPSSQVDDSSSINDSSSIEDNSVIVSDTYAVEAVTRYHLDNAVNDIRNAITGGSVDAPVDSNELFVNLAFAQGALQFAMDAVEDEGIEGLSIELEVVDIALTIVLDGYGPSSGETFTDFLIQSSLVLAELESLLERVE